MSADNANLFVKARSTNIELGASDRSHLGVRPVSFWLLTTQLGLVFAVVFVYRLEFERGFGVIAGLTWFGFLVHSWLPPSWRLKFFLLLTMAAMGILLKTNAIWLVVIGVGLIGLCHLPAPWWMRVTLVIATGSGLAGMQSGFLYVSWAHAVIPVLGAMFMFRIILYLYDLKSEMTPATYWERLAYFFLLPNVCFPLFPVVDYRTFLSTYYNAPASDIYQKGVYWILRGVMHLLFYRVIYYLLPRADTDLSGVVGVYVFMVMTYGLYLRVSGIFHIITGILCVFGFNLPRTNNHYFLASSFSDLWRRINIYWKEFMTTIVFYPVLMGLRSFNMTVRLIVATLSVFVVTWFLHSYQWFWLEGMFPISTTDVVFWGVLGIVLAMNSVWEARQGRERRLGGARWTLGSAARVALNTWLVFSSMAVLWSLWDSGSILDWSYRILRVRESTYMDWAVFTGLSVLFLVSGILGQWLSAKGWGLRQLESILEKNAWKTVIATASMAVLVGIPAVHASLGPYVTRTVLRAKSTTPNRLDLERVERGYYETLTRSSLQQPQEGRIEDLGWIAFRETAAVVPTRDIRSYTLAPRIRVVWKGAQLETNRWGMRDKDYTQTKSPGVRRIALLGSSHVMGLGVEQDETFDHRFEEYLNENTLLVQAPTYEVLNFAVGGYGLLQLVYVTKHVTPPFAPDIVLCFVHPNETNRMINWLRTALEDGAELEEEYSDVARIIERADARFGLPSDEYRRRLSPYSDELLTWSFREMALAIKAQGAIPVFVLLPLTNKEFDVNEARQMTQLARDVGAVSIQLTNVYEGYKPENLGVSQWDNHPNALGHKLIADELLKQLNSSGMLLPPNSRRN